jgi:membrane-associated protease RseP (regulator of RpoE activity)
MVALVFGTGVLVQAQDEAAGDGGPVIQIGKGDAEAESEPFLKPAPTDGAIVDEPAAPKYWIGLVGGPIDAVHPLRAHVDIPEKQGLLVVNVVPDSPAAKAGLKQNDILLRANDIDLREMQDLVELVLTEGEKKGQIAIDVLRRGQRETVYVTPEVRPADAGPQGGIGRGFGTGFGVPGGVEIPQDLLREFGEMPFEFRQFGPGVIVGGGAGAANLPNGVTVSIVKENDQPARITVKRGGETWEVVGDDPKSLDQLPDDVRPFVEQMLHGRPLGMNLRGPGRAVLPDLGDGRLRDRLERMEQRLEALQERLLAPEDQGQGAETK